MTTANRQTSLRVDENLIDRVIEALWTDPFAPASG